VFEQIRDVPTKNVSSRELPVFVTEEDRAKLMAINDEALRHWPVPFETFFVHTRFGRAHVIASEDPALPPLVMTHPMGTRDLPRRSPTGSGPENTAASCWRKLSGRSGPPS
jgi:hypothetical protein